MVAERTDILKRPASLGETILRLRGVSRSFGEPPHQIEVLHGVDLDIESGRLTLVMGPSGSGKTTLLTIMGLLLRPTRGTVELAGRDITGCTEADLPAIRREHVSFVFQAFNLLSALTAAENVQVTLALQGVHGKEAEKRSLELLSRVGLRDRARHRPAEMSGGEKQRVGVARALASPARLILADEPTGNLDGATSKRVVDLLRRLAHDEGRAVVVVTHDPRLEELADRIVRIEDGQIRPDDEGLS